MTQLDARHAALLVIDVQQAFVEMASAGNARNNPQAEANIAALLAACRGAGVPVIHIRHASRHAHSPFRRDKPGFAVQPFAAEHPGELVVTKSANSAFIGTDLEARLQAWDIASLIITGATTNHCVETTTRMAGNLGYSAFLVRDATWTYGRTGPDGEHHRAEDIHQMSLANLAGEFAAITTTAAIIADIQISQPQQRAG
ncbi:MAG: cysteine hydrolase [Hyphomicrobiales bacterium]|nr:cysteine hydrolase [Hyphomicrobiales bacterium]OQW84506.1 MAG: cysteine hydrolase [Proteobacteria bacterium ST_bin15]